MKKIKTANRYVETVGRRKTSVARVRITPATRTAPVTINNRPLDNYFSTLELRRAALAPLQVPAALATGSKLTISVKVTGGGVASQAGAIAHGLARALVKQAAACRPFLKKLQFLRRDSRMKERRKFGLKKARKAPQWSKR